MTALAGRVCGIGDEAAVGGLDQIRVHREIGLAGIELRTVHGRGVHELTDDEARALADALAGAGLMVPVVDTPVGSWAVTVGVDLDTEIDVLARAARRAAWFDCRRLRVMSYPNDGRPEPEWRAEAWRRMKVLTSVATDLDVVLLHENCHGWGGQSHQHTLELMSEVDNPRLRLVFDIGNGIAYGYESLPFLAAVLPWVEHVHVKDGHRNAKGEAVFSMPGDGKANVEACVRLLERSGYRGWYSIEPHVALIPHLGVSGDPDRQESAYRTYASRFLDLGRVIDE